jgi:hypothetical protein
VTAVQGKQPINDPSMESARGTSHTPQAMLIPDHGTTPMRRRTERRTQAGVVFGDSDLPEISGSAEPDKALRVISSARGKRLVKKGPSGFESREAHADPSMVRVVSRMVA